MSASGHAEERCGLLSNTNAGDAPRFRILDRFGHDAFLDMQTCLVWDLEVSAERQALKDAMYLCANKGTGGPDGGFMGWRLPAMAELASLDTKDWAKQADAFKKYKLPPLVRSEAEFWTVTPWPSVPDTWAAVQFSGLTTVVYPKKQDGTGSAWCVRGVPATGLQ